MIKLLPGPRVGAGIHRYGWPLAVEALSPLVSPHGILLDDFVEAAFLYVNAREPRREPWLGVFHHPPGMPAWYRPDTHLERLWERVAFTESLPTLCGAVAFGPNLGRWLEDRLQRPVHVLKIPTGPPLEHWSPTALTRPQLVQAGWFLRNTRAIYQVRVPRAWQRLCVLPEFPWTQSAHA